MCTRSPVDARQGLLATCPLCVWGCERAANPQLRAAEPCHDLHTGDVDVDVPPIPEGKGRHDCLLARLRCGACAIVVSLTAAAGERLVFVAGTGRVCVCQCVCVCVCVCGGSRAVHSAVHHTTCAITWQPPP
jgi:hypothetical protein